MATTCPENLAPSSSASDRGAFFVLYPALCAGVAVLGFVPTFWLPLAEGSFSKSPLVLTHGLVFTAWVILLVAQAVQIERGRVRRHMAWGLAGISLASMMLLLGIATAVAGMANGISAGRGDQARAFSIVPLSIILLFFALFAAAIANIDRPHWHKRLMLVATVSALPPAFARPVRILGDIPFLTPEIALIPSAFVLVLLVVGMTWDRRSNGSWHPSWLIGIAATLLIATLRIPVSTSETWLRFASWMLDFV